MSFFLTRSATAIRYAAHNNKPFGTPCALGSMEFRNRPLPGGRDHHSPEMVPTQMCVSSFTHWEMLERRRVSPTADTPAKTHAGRPHDKFRLLECQNV